MKLDVDLDTFTHSGDKDFRLADHPQSLGRKLYENKADYRTRIAEFQREIDALQSMMYAHDRYAMLLIFQAMDAAGKDGTIKHVMAGVNPHGVKVYSFKKPSAREIDHGFLWRTNVAMPERGRIAIFNRSYYEEVLVTRVHPGIITGGQRLPAEQTKTMSRLWKQRYAAIRNLEQYLHDNGTQVLKFFLNVSKDEQRARFLSRIDEPEKNWKFSEADVAERQHWKSYMKAYQHCIDKTSSSDAPWYVVPADDKKNMRLIVSKIVLSRMKQLDLHYPEVSDERRAQLQDYRQQLDEG
ncbi:MAG: polyphosphate kinase 2 family protein [Deltaproteobacteria bacterium]|nr:polyphosphate kinase 2 family protein [Deltaproteobacteria bacterium]